MPKFASEAERLRHHRKCFELALEMGCTPKDAELWLNETQRREAHRAKMAAGGLTSKLPDVPTPSRVTFERWDAPWMGRD